MNYMRIKKVSGITAYILLLSVFVACSKNFKQEKEVLVDIVDNYFHNIDSSTAESYKMDIKFDAELQSNTKSYLREWISQQDSLPDSRQQMLQALLQEDQRKLSVKEHELSESTLYKLTNTDSSAQGEYKVGFNKLAWNSEKNIACTIIDKTLKSGEGMAEEGTVEIAFFKNKNNEWVILDRYTLQHVHNE